MTNAVARPEQSLIDFVDHAWTIHNIVKTLHAALPDDGPECDVPARCLLRHVLELTEPLALGLMNANRGAGNA
ncbi:hypothetical protein QZM43_12170 [Burkholderia orbicola]|uniref:hypothetical protein n=1 Tax=Burkholderia orbicola TaxID=2978683 RepID=UPI002652D5EE|nr:hypothetical protein [Burkholderia orbicola]MDN7503484.1 hypothetical protein [Burkholderia orbicola]